MPFGRKSRSQSKNREDFELLESCSFNLPIEEVVSQQVYSEPNINIINDVVEPEGDPVPLGLGILSTDHTQDPAFTYFHTRTPYRSCITEATC